MKERNLKTLLDHQLCCFFLILIVLRMEFLKHCDTVWNLARYNLLGFEIIEFDVIIGHKIISNLDYSTETYFIFLCSEMF